MLLLSRRPPADEVFAFCEQWLTHLSGGRYREAHGMLLPHSQRRWTPELIEQVISNYGTLPPDGRRGTFRVTAFDTAGGAPDVKRLRVDPGDDTCSGEVHPRYPFAVYQFLHGPSRRGSVGRVHLDYPLNGRWSDLSTTFDMIPCGDGLGLGLIGIEVM
jgi:hypothetical protein